MCGRQGEMRAARTVIASMLVVIGGCGTTPTSSERAANDLTTAGAGTAFAAVDERGKWADIRLERGRTLDTLANPRAQGEGAEAWIEVRVTYQVVADRDGKPVGALADWWAYQRTSRGMVPLGVLFGVATGDQDPLPQSFGGVQAGDRLDGWIYVPVLEGEFSEIWLAFLQRQTGQSGWTGPDWDVVEKHFLLQR
jgi:hypothetical protein